MLQTAQAALSAPQAALKLLEKVHELHKKSIALTEGGAPKEWHSLDDVATVLADGSLEREIMKALRTHFRGS